ncbi:hypothetical protein OAT67_00410 [Bacteriovoracaceae bacterium]|nr:hypothetical protein [Bacteriovoracaceae bacterium]
MDSNAFTASYDFLSQQVDWDKVHNLIIQHTFFDHTKDIFMAPWANMAYSPSESIKDIENISLNVQEAPTLFRQAFSGIDPSIRLSNIVKLIEKDYVLSLSEIFNLSILTRNSSKFLKHFKSTNLYSLYEDLDTINFKKFNQECNKLFTSSGSIQFQNHPKLSQLDKKISEVEVEIRQQIKHVFRNFKDRGITNQDTFDIYNDRFVIAVNSDKYSSNLGIIRGNSKSGFTLYIEPVSIKSLNDLLNELYNKLDHELYLLRKKLTTILFNNKNSIVDLISLITQFDQLLSKYSFANKYNMCPFIESTKSFLFKDIAHPLITNPITNNIDTKNGILISGPNTGGKSVLLKSIALVIIFAKSGMYVPCSYAEGEIPDKLLLLINNTQNLTDGLSSFSLECHNLLDSINEDGKNILIIDEIFRSTSSVEASEISYHVIKEALNNDNTVFVSTHHELLKDKIERDPVIDSGHVRFNHETNKPTFEFIQGKSGSSYAVKIFKQIEKEKFGFHLISNNFYKDNLEQNVKVSNNDDEVISLLSKLSDQEKEHKKTVSSLNIKLIDQEKKFTVKYDKLNSRLIKIRNDIVNKKSNREEIKELNQLQSTLNTSQSVFLPAKEELKLEQLKIGINLIDKVSRKEVIVTSIDKRKKIITVTQGKLKMKLPLSNLKLSKNAAPQQKISINVFKNSKPEIMHDFRGVRLEEFENKLIDIINTVISGDIPYAHVVYGHGDGILKSKIVELKKNYPEVLFEHPNGDDGAVNIQLIK